MFNVDNVHITLISADILSIIISNHDRDSFLFEEIIINIVNVFRPLDPLEDCSVKNCKFTGDDEKLLLADAVIVHVLKGLFPNTTTRNLTQRWIFLNDESPQNAFYAAVNKPKLKDLSNMFNWSMTYRYYSLKQ